ncbi:MAG: CHAT domain-containing protein [Phycisphaerales bacterium]
MAVFDFLAPATVANLQATLQRALARGAPYHIVHFDGHGVYDPHGGLGQLVFEAEQDLAATSRGKHLVDAHALGANIANQGVQLFFLEACQSAKSEQAPNASVAGRLLQAGVPSVVAMSHSVLVETARQFTGVFYPALVRGRRVGTAMLEGQRTLARDKRRGYRWEPDADREKPLRRLPLELDDWFVPILYQHRDDPPVLTTPAPPARVQQELAVERGSSAAGSRPRPRTPSWVAAASTRRRAPAARARPAVDPLPRRGRRGQDDDRRRENGPMARDDPSHEPRAFASVEFADDLRACSANGRAAPAEPVRRGEPRTRTPPSSLLVRCLDDRPAS